MALTKSNIGTRYPLPVYSYKVMIDGKTIPFSQVSGLNIEREHVVYKHGFSYTAGYNIIRGRVKPFNMTMKKGIVKSKSDLFQWINVREGYYSGALGGLLGKKPAKDLVVDLCDEKGQATVRWKVSGAVPLKLEAPAFDANTTDVAIESLELIAQGLEVEYL